MGIVLALMPNAHQRRTLEALLGQFLEANGHPLPEHCQLKSSSAISRFLNSYDWPTRKVISTFRNWIIEHLLTFRKKGRPPHLQVLLDLTTLEKSGRFQGLDGLITTYNGKRGLHVVVLYLVVGQWRIPWAWRIYRGKEHPSQAQLGLRLLSSLSQKLKKHFKIMVLADTAFSSVEFLQTLRRKKLHALVGVPRNRCLQDGRKVEQLHKSGQQVYLEGLPLPVTVAHYYLQRDGIKQKRYIICTRTMKASTMVWWGKRRWKIEGFFKTAKHRFGLHRFGQSTRIGVYRWLILSLIAFVLAVWGYWVSGLENIPDWGMAAQIARKLLLPQVILVLLIQEIKLCQALARKLGVKIQVQVNQQ